MNTDSEPTSRDWHVPFVQRTKSRISAGRSRKYLFGRASGVLCRRVVTLANFRVVCFAGCDAGAGVLTSGVLVAPVFFEDLRAGAMLLGNELTLVWLSREFV